MHKLFVLIYVAAPIQKEKRDRLFSFFFFQITKTTKIRAKGIQYPIFDF
jgi:hypothetical protein